MCASESNLTLSEKSQKYLVLLCFIVSTFVQLGRYSYSSNLNLFIDRYNITDKLAGIPTTLFFITYAVGQIVNALFCSKYNKKFLVGLSLIFSGIINVIICFKIPFKLLCLLWFINGILQSTFWPLLILILSESVDNKRFSTMAFLMSISVSGGTLLSYVLSAVFSLGGGIAYVCSISGGIIVLIAFVWFFTTKNIERNNVVKLNEIKERKPDRQAIVLIVVFALFGMVSTAISYGLRNWLPKILKDLYVLEDWLSIFLSVFLPLSSTITAFVSNFVYKKYRNFTVICSVAFAITGVLLIVIIAILNVSWIPVLALLILLNLSTSVVVNLMTVHVPIFFKNNVSSGFLAGLLNGFCYVGTSISTYGLGAISTATGEWSIVFIVFAIVCFVTFGVALLFIKKEKQRNKIIC